MSILLTLLGISLLIILHEAGHYLVARACGMRVSRFSLGFGPALLRRQVGETIWQVAAVPLGGYVLIEGMGPAEGEEEAAAADTDPRSYKNKPAWQRAAVIFAGPLTNWLITAVLLMGLAMTTGFARYDETQPVLGEIMADGPAAQAGLQAGDRVQRIGGVEVADWSTLVREIRAHPNTPLAIAFERDGAPMHRTVTPKLAAGVGVMEVMPSAHLEQFSPGAAVVAGIEGAWHLTCEQARMLLGMFTGKAGGQLSGLPGIVKAVSKQAEQSLARLFDSLAYLSIGLCLLNLLPVPALDGSRLLFLGVEMVRRRPVDERIEGLIHTAGFVLLLGVMVFVSVRDLL
jgi:regulator of sigma E protease